MFEEEKEDEKYDESKPPKQEIKNSIAIKKTHWVNPLSQEQIRNSLRKGQVHIGINTIEIKDNAEKITLAKYFRSFISFSKF